jgi:hypothetical protein
MEKQVPLSWSEEFLGVNLNKWCANTAKAAYYSHAYAGAVTISVFCVGLGGTSMISQERAKEPDVATSHVTSQTRGSGVLEQLRSGGFTVSTSSSSGAELRAHAIMTARAGGQLSVFELA